MTKIKNFLKKFSRKKDKNKVLFKTKNKKNFLKKRNNFDISFKFKKPSFILNKNYIPYFFIAGISFIVIILFIIFGPIFRLQNINITKKDSFTNIDIIYKSLDDFRGDSIFNMEKSYVLQRIQDYQENIKNIELNIDFPKTLNIVAESFKEKFNVSINSKNYVLLENGALVPTINPIKDLKNLEIIKTIDKARILEYKKIFDMDYLTKIEALEKKINENIPQIEINEIKYYENEIEVHFILNKFTRIIFSLDGSNSIDEQIKNLAIIDRDKSEISKNDKVYIDLRIPGKVYICSVEGQRAREKESQCNQNLSDIYSQL